MKKRRQREARARQLHVMMSAEELGMLETLSRAGGLSKSDVVRQAIRERLRISRTTTDWQSKREKREKHGRA